jgi:AhpD family alkylhydroperoxidase
MKMSANNSRVAYDAFVQSAPDVYAALISLGKSTSASSIDPGLIELVKLRVSQINGCAFCLQYHLGVARGLKIAKQKLDLLATWHDAGIFSQREMAALAWAEALTKLDSYALYEQLWATVREQFTEAEAIYLTAAIGTINMWNRLGVGFRFSPQAQ